MMIRLRLLREGMGQQCPPGYVWTTGSSGPTEWASCQPAPGGTGGGATALPPAGGGGAGMLPGAGGAPIPITIAPPAPSGTVAPTAPPPMPRPVIPGMPPAGMPPPPANGAEPLPPGTVAPGPSAPVDPGMVERLLAQTDRAWEAAETAILRGRRCGASEAEKEAARRARECLATFTRSAGSLSAASAELCAAKSQGRDARLGPAQVAALEAMAKCLSDGDVPAAAESSPGWLRALVGTGVPAAATAVLVAL